MRNLNGVWFSALLVLAFVGLPLAALRAADSVARDRELVIEQFDIADSTRFMMLPVNVGGNVYRFVLDTGASHTIYGEPFRAWLGAPRASAKVAMLGSRATIDVFEPPEARVGSLSLKRGVSVGCHDLSGLRSKGGPIEGVIGQTFLRHHVVRFDFDNNQVAFLKAVGADAGLKIRLHRRRGVYCADIEIPGYGTERFMLDTGDVCDAGSLSPRVASVLAAKGLAQEVSQRQAVSISGIEALKRYRLSEIEIAGFRHRGLVLVESKALHTSTLGLKYLRRFVVTIDFPNWTMYLKPSRFFSEANSGVALERKQDRFWVKLVEDGSEGARAGIRVGDEIVSIGDVSLASLDNRQLRSLFVHTFFTAGSVSRLAIERTGQPMSVRLDLPAADCPPSATAAYGALRAR